MAEVPIEKQIACVERELRMRANAYPRWVGAGKMSQARADSETADMEAVLKTLRTIRDARQPDLLAGKDG